MWDANSFDFQSVPFVKAAWEAKKWAFVTDYIRLYALYTEGGVYLDSDVKTFRRFDDFLNNRFFIGLEPLVDGKIKTVESAIMGAEAGHQYVKECLDYYDTLQFVNDREFMWVNTCPMIMSKIMEKYDYKYVYATQSLSEGIKIYVNTYFGHGWDADPAKCYAIHYFNNGWIDWRKKDIVVSVYEFCRKNDLLRTYSILRKVFAPIKPLYRLYKRISSK